MAYLSKSRYRFGQVESNFHGGAKYRDEISASDFVMPVVQRVDAFGNSVIYETVDLTNLVTEFDPPLDNFLDVVRSTVITTSGAGAGSITLHGRDGHNNPVSCMGIGITGGSIDCGVGFLTIESLEVSVSNPGITATIRHGSRTAFEFPVEELGYVLTGVAGGNAVAPFAFVVADPRGTVGTSAPIPFAAIYIPDNIDSLERS